MIILQTGVPGSGKTASVVHMLMTDKSYTHFTDKDEQVKKRPLFVNGIPEFKLEHIELDDEQIKDQPLQDFLPYGSLVVIDEAQRLFGRISPAKLPPYIESLALHRHHGLDIVFITQHPSFLDPFVRKLVQRHMHVSIKAVGRKLYEWNECVDQPDSSVNIAKAIERSFTLPKKAFEQYKSAEVHTKPKRRIPKSLVFLILFIPLLLGYGAKVYLGLKDRYIPEEQQVEQQSDSVYSGQNYAQSGNQGSGLGRGLTAAMYAPTIPEKPESKPLYDTVRQVTTFERVAACISGGKSGCTCYSDQATALKEVSHNDCQKYVDNGLPFNPFKQQQEQQVQQQDSQTKEGA